MTVIDAPQVTDPALAEDDPIFTHIVVPADAVTEAIILGTPVTALCGYTWVPTKDPKKYPVCAMCDEILAEIVLNYHGHEARE